MNITIKKSLDTTPSLETYIDKKLAPLSKFLKHFEENGEVELWLEVSRTTKHHNKGEELFKAVANLQLPGKMLRSEACAPDIRKAIDTVRDMLHMEIEKYKEKHEKSAKHSREEK